MLDTDVASYAIKGRSPEITARLKQVELSLVCISAVTRAELIYGLKSLPSTHRLHHIVQQFLELVNVLCWDGEAADYYAEIRHQLTGKGQPIGELDMMIAAHALAAGAVLVTNNQRHFERIGLPLRLASWVTPG